MRAAAFQEHPSFKAELPSFKAELPPAQLRLCRTFVGDVGRAWCPRQRGGLKNDSGSRCGAGKCLLGEWGRFILLFLSQSSSPALRSWRCWTAPLLQGTPPRDNPALLAKASQPPQVGKKNGKKNTPRASVQAIRRMCAVGIVFPGSLAATAFSWGCFCP